jgi:GAF domain-containing protein
MNQLSLDSFPRVTLTHCDRESIHIQVQFNRRVCYRCAPNPNSRLRASVSIQPCSWDYRRNSDSENLWPFLRVHKYLRNMGVGASISISLIKDQQLWGLIACHYNSPFFVP